MTGSAARMRPRALASGASSYRVAAIGGTLRMESPAGQGTLAVAEMPIA